MDRDERAVTGERQPASEGRFAAERLRAADRLQQAASPQSDEAGGGAGGPESVRPDASPEWRDLFLAVRRNVERLRE